MRILGLAFYTPLTLPDAHITNLTAIGSCSDDVDGLRVDPRRSPFKCIVPFCSSATNHRSVLICFGCIYRACSNAVKRKKNQGRSMGISIPLLLV
jgi:hypothetical protein